MNTLLKLEGLGLFLFSIFLFSRLGYDWWWYPLLILTPDLSMVGYLRGPRLGAMVYNTFHHQALAVAVYLLGTFLNLPALQLAGVILFGHSNMDRALGYGLKHTDSFQNTHLGRIGK